MKKRGTFVLAVLLLLVSLLPVSAQEPVVEAVLFYSPSCPHCHDVIDNLLLPMETEYGEQLHVMAVDVSQPQGQAIYQAAIVVNNIPDSRLGVPTLIVGNTVLVGSGEIPGQFPGIVEAALLANGIPLPNLPGLTPAVDSGLLEVSAAPAQLDAASAIVAWVTLLALLLALGYAVIHLTQRRRWFQIDGPLLIYAETWAVPVLIGVGFVVSLYLSYVEMTQVEAVCGPIPGCNTVQTSAYASILGVPVAVIGVLNYLVLGGLWVARRFVSPALAEQSKLTMLGLAFVGTVFSIYLTAVEIFAIHAVCLWCITSAWVTGTLLVLLAILISGERMQRRHSKTRRKVRYGH